MKTNIKIGEDLYQVEVSEIKEGLLQVEVNKSNYFFAKNEFGELVPVGKEAFQSWSDSEKIEIARLGFEEKEIKSPIAGRVSAIYVKEHDLVKPGQRVATLIAMKMENEIISETHGRVKEVKAKENKCVSANEALIVLE